VISAALGVKPAYVPTGLPSCPNPTANPAGVPKGLTLISHVSRRWIRLCSSAAGVAVASAGLTVVAAGTASASPAVSTAVTYAAQEAGKPYVYGATGPNAFDCSGLVQFVYRRLGVSLPRTAAQQYAAMRHVSQAAKVPGDVLFFYTGGSITHDAIYAGGNQMWAAPTSGGHVQRQAIYSSQYYVGAPATATVAAHAVAAASKPAVARKAAVSTPVVARKAAVKVIPAVAISTGSPTLQRGATGAAVVTLQHLLGVAADGDFGPQTAAAVRAFQHARHLTVDGVVGPQTWTSLRTAAA
jgi:peptidoglycan hydrolase-like protein with peptidoglycan-binding domain